MQKIINKAPLLLLLNLLLFFQLKATDTLNASLKNEVQSLKATFPKRPPISLLATEWDTAQFKLNKVQFLLDNYKNAPNVYPYVRQELARIKSISFALKHNKLPILSPGFKEAAYYADNDDSFQPFIYYIPSSIKKDSPIPLLIFLHGYSPDLNIVNWTRLPKGIKALANKTGFAILMPFGRGNTDYQGIGEQDVLNALKTMCKRFNIDKSRIILSGHSMGGMGVWTIGNNFPDRFAGLLIIAGRGDYYFWHNQKREALPLYKRIQIDHAFGTPDRAGLKSIPILCYHGTKDPLINIAEARHMANIMQKKNKNFEFYELPGEDHWITKNVFSSPKTLNWLRSLKLKKAIKVQQTYSPEPTNSIKDAFLTPFLFVKNASYPNFEARIKEWSQFAQAQPRTKHENKLTETDRQNYHLFLFGEPENSDLIKHALKQSPVKITDKHYIVAQKKYPRENCGLYLKLKNPWNKSKSVIIQSGLSWGKHASFNHKYDSLPGFIIYTNKKAKYDPDGGNQALCAGFLTENGTIDEKTLYTKAD